MAPNHAFIVQQAAREYGHLLETNDYPSIYRFMVDILGPRMKAQDPNWGFLSKLPAEKHLTLLPSGQLIGVDAFCYRPGEEVIDVLTNALDPGPSGPAWQPKERRPTSHWLEIGASTGNGGGGNGGGTEDEDIAALKRQVAIQGAQIQGLQDQMHRLEAAMAAGLTLTGRKVALLASDGLWVCSDRNQHNHLISNRRYDPDRVGAWEIFELLEK